MRSDGLRAMEWKVRELSEVTIRKLTGSRSGSDGGDGQ